GSASLYCDIAETIASSFKALRAAQGRIRRNGRKIAIIDHPQKSRGQARLSVFWNMTGSRLCADLGGLRSLSGKQTNPITGTIHQNIGRRRFQGVWRQPVGAAN